MLDGERSAKLDAPVSAVYAVVADLPGYVDWHPFFATVDVTGTDAEGRPSGLVFWRFQLPEEEIVTPVGTIVPLASLRVA